MPLPGVWGMGKTQWTLARWDNIETMLQKRQRQLSLILIEKTLTILWIVHIVMALINDLFSSKYKKFVWGRYVFRQICSSLWIGKGKGKLGDSSSFSASPKFYKFFLEKLTTTRLGNIQEPFVIWPLQTFQHHVRTIKTRSQITHSNILSEISHNKTTSPIPRYYYRI